MESNSQPLDPGNRFFTLTIILDRMNRTVGLQGNLSDKDFCINLLASAIHAVVSLKGKGNEEKKIVVPKFIPPKEVRNG